MGLRNIFEPTPLRFVLFGGKGGVGKTSCAAAAALYSANNGYRTLVISTDPAHSLSDSFAQDLSGGEIVPVKGVKNLFAQEINPKKAMEEFNSKMMVQAQTSDMMMPDLLAMSTDMQFPGMDEALAFTKVLELINESTYDVVIFDTAPTGHTLRLLSIPEVMDSMIGRLLKLQLRLKGFFSSIKSLFGGSSDEDRTLEYLKHMQTVIKEARVILSDKTQTTFVPVTIPAIMAIEETERLLMSLYTYEIPVKYIIINMITPENPSCPFCSVRHKVQVKHVKQIVDMYQDDFEITLVPLFAEEIRGLDKLRELADILFNEDKKLVI